MTPEEFANEKRDLGILLRWIFTVLLALVLFAGFIGGVAVGCQSNLARNDRIAAQRQQYKAKKAFYALCQRRALAGTPMAGCPK